MAGHESVKFFPESCITKAIREAKKAGTFVRETTWGERRLKEAYRRNHEPRTPRVSLSTPTPTIGAIIP